MLVRPALPQGLVKGVRGEKACPGPGPRGSDMGERSSPGVELRKARFWSRQWGPPDPGRRTQGHTSEGMTSASEPPFPFGPVAMRTPISLTRRRRTVLFCPWPGGDNRLRGMACPSRPSRNCRKAAAASDSGSVTKASKPACARRICWHHARRNSLRTKATRRRRGR